MRNITRRLLSRQTISTVVLLGILLLYLALIGLVNFSGRPEFYISDMYADLMFAETAWEAGTLFPENWVFGNQLYVAATPALAALYSAVAPTPQTAMALAASTMTLLTLATFLWLMKGILPSIRDRLLCIVLFITMELYFGDPVYKETGWQLFFTMCAYYSCYLIGALLAFGCYIRADGSVDVKFWCVLCLSCLLSFGTGVQSLRQTAVMAVPMAGVACLRLLWDLYKRKPWRRRSLLVAVLCLVCNVAGLGFGRMLSVKQVEIYGSLRILQPKEMLPAAAEGIHTVASLLDNGTTAGSWMRIVLLALSCFFAGEMIIREQKQRDRCVLDSPKVLLWGLMLLSILTIWAIDGTTTLYIRHIYYFMLYPLIAFTLTYGYSRRKEWKKILMLIMMVVYFVCPAISSHAEIFCMARHPQEGTAYEVSDYLLENGYTTVYAKWNHGTEIAIASDCQIQVGFWYEPVFCAVRYLCDPSILEVDSEKCAYILRSDEEVQAAQEYAAQLDIQLTLEEYFSEIGIYIYTATENMMY